MLVGLTGLARSGKDTVGAHLESKGFLRSAFAAPMKTITKAIDPLLEYRSVATGGLTNGLVEGFIRLSDALTEGDEDYVKQAYPEYRRFLQRLGTEAFREYDENFWINWLFNSIPEGTQHVCITDVRFPNELERIRSEGGIVWRVEREGIVNNDPHPSEKFIMELEVDEVIENNGTLDDLYSKVDKLLGI